MPGYNTTRYKTQNVAMLYFYGALALFIAQVAFGVVAGLIYVLPNTLSVILPFNIVRMIHTNALVVWLLLGFMGATYYLLPEEAQTELYSPKLAVAQFWIFFIAALKLSRPFSPVGRPSAPMRPFSLRMSLL